MALSVANSDFDSVFIRSLHLGLFLYGCPHNDWISYYILFQFIFRSFFILMLYKKLLIDDNLFILCAAFSVFMIHVIHRWFRHLYLYPFLTSISSMAFGTAFFVIAVSILRPKPIIEPLNRKFTANSGGFVIVLYENHWNFNVSKIRGSIFRFKRLFLVRSINNTFK